MFDLSVISQLLSLGMECKEQLTRGEVKGH